MEHHSMSAGEFKNRYGVTPQEVQDALDENRRRVARKLSEWGYGWAVDEVMCDVAVELLKGGLRRWASYEDRKPLGAFVNTLLGNRLGEWMRTERPKYRGGMTHAPQTRRKRSTNTSSQGEALNADEARGLIRREDHAASEGRLCEEDDVFGDPDSNVLAAPAGDRSSYQEWLTGGDQPQGLTSDEYKDDMKYLENECVRQDRDGRTLWRMLVRQCLTVTRGADALRGDIRRFLENSHRGRNPRIEDYPYILAAINKYKTGNKTGRRTR